MIECCSELAHMSSGYEPKNWSMAPRTVNQWGGPPPARFVLTGFPIATPRAAVPPVMSPSRTSAAA